MTPIALVEFLWEFFWGYLEFRLMTFCYVYAVFGLLYIASRKKTRVILDERASALFTEYPDIVYAIGMLTPLTSMLLGDIIGSALVAAIVK